MAEDTENLVIEILRKLQADMATLREDTRTIKLRITALEHHFSTLVASLAGQNDRIDTLERRVERIERRLELSGEP